MRGWCLVLSAVALVAGPPEVNADCPSADGCNMAQEVQAELLPDEPCVDVRTGDDSCECTSWVSLENNCGVNLQATDFAFGFCMIEDQLRHEGCPDIIPPGSWGAVYLPLDPTASPGTYEESVHLSVSGKNIALELSYEVVQVESGCGCAANRSGGSASVALLLLLSFRARRRVSR